MTDAAIGDYGARVRRRLGMVSSAVVGDEPRIADMLPPSWFFWTLFALFAVFCPLFIWLWLRKRREYAEFVASHAWVEGVVVDRTERMIDKGGQASTTRVEVTVEYRDRQGAVHRMSDEEGSFFRFVGDITPVIYDLRVPSDARLEVHRRSEYAFLGVSVLFVVLTLLFFALALVAG
jgi:hypothetical protein